MSYDLMLVDPETRECMHLSRPHRVRGGTYAVGGTTELTVNITYNYGSHFRRVFGESGIRTLYGLTGQASLAVLDAAMAQLGDDVSDNYWDATEGNAKAALRDVRQLAEWCPHSVWTGD